MTDPPVSARERVQTMAFVAGSALVRIVPEGLSRPLFRWAADLVWRRHGPSVGQLERNLRRAGVRDGWLSARACARVRHAEVSIHQTGLGARTRAAWPAIRQFSAGLSGPAVPPPP